MNSRRLKACQWLAVGALSCLASGVNAEGGVDEKLQAQFQQALEMRDTGDLYGAIELLNGILANQPELHRARLELAVAYYRAARFEQAMAAARKALSDTQLPESARESVQLFLDQIEDVAAAEKGRRHRLSRSVGIGVGHDDNVNVGPNSDVFEVNGRELTLATDAKPKSDAFTTLRANLDHSYRLGGSFNLGERPVMGFWQSSASVLRKTMDDYNRHTVDVISASTGLGLVSRQQWRAKANIQMDYIRLGEDPLALFTSLNPSYTYVDGDNEYTLRGQWLYREYLRAVDSDREGHRLSVGADYSRRLQHDLVLQVGATVSDQNARVDDQRYKSYDIYSSLLWRAWDNGNTFARASYRHADYQGRVALFNEGREEREQRYVIGANHNFRQGVLEDWRLGARLSYTENHSPQDIYEFDRTEFTVDLTRNF